MKPTWNPADFMKSTWNLADFTEFKWHSPLSSVWSEVFPESSDLKVLSHKIHNVKSARFQAWNLPFQAWNLLDFMWNPPDIMKSGGFHTKIYILQENKLLGLSPRIGLSYERLKRSLCQKVYFTCIGGYSIRTVGILRIRTRLIIRWINASTPAIVTHIYICSTSWKK